MINVCFENIYFQHMLFSTTSNTLCSLIKTYFIWKICLDQKNEICYLLLRIADIEKIYFQNKHLSLNHQYFHLISSINRRIKYLCIGYYCYCESDHSVLLYCVLFPFLYRKEKHFLRNMSKTTKGIATNALLHIWKKKSNIFCKTLCISANCIKM